MGKVTTNTPKAKLTNKKRRCHRKIRQKRRLLIRKHIQILKKNLDLDNLALSHPHPTLHIFLLFIRFGPNISCGKKRCELDQISFCLAVEMNASFFNCMKLVSFVKYLSQVSCIFLALLTILCLHSLLSIVAYGSLAPG